MRKTALASTARRVLGFLDKNAIWTLACLIFGYYLLASVDIFKRAGENLGVLAYFLQFDSLILLWVIAAVVVKLQSYRKKLKEEEAYKRQIMSEYQRERVKLSILDDISAVLSDNINNPLAVITISVGTLREKYQLSNEVIDTLERIDNAGKRIREVLADIKTHQTEQIVRMPNRYEQPSVHSKSPIPEHESSSDASMHIQGEADHR